jgi:uncharacterized protein (DUF302 family)
MTELRYGFETQLRGLDFDEAIERVSGALQKEGFGVLTHIDVQATFAKKLDIEFRPYAILGACNPQLAKRAIDVEPQIGLLLPCNVVVQKLDDGNIGVSIADPAAMFMVVDNPQLKPVADEAEARMRRVLADLASG